MENNEINQQYQTLLDMGYSPSAVSEALEYACKAALELPPSYHTDYFFPHTWVVLAVLKARGNSVEDAAQ